MAPRPGSRVRQDGPRDLQPTPTGVAGDAAEAEHLRDLLQQVDRVPPAAAGELERLLERAAQGDAAARQRLFELNLAMVMRLAAARADRGLSLGDLFQEGSLGLLEAIQGQASSRPAEFAALAEEQTAAAMESALQAADVARRDQERLVEDAETFQRVQLRLTRDLKRPPTAREMGEKLEWPVERVELIGELVEEARHRHDLEILDYLDTEELDAEDVFFANGNGEHASGDSSEP